MAFPSLVFNIAHLTVGYKSQTHVCKEKTLDTILRL